MNICPICKRSFIPHGRIRCCSMRCRAKYQSLYFRGDKSPSWKRVKFKCKVCTKILLVWPTLLKKRRTCSLKCRSIYYKKTRTGKNAAHWNGGRYEVSGGYIYVWKPSHPHASKDGYVLEHRLVIERKIGRILTRREIVHHINHVRSDNRPSNLMLFPSISAHVRHHGSLRLPNS